MGRKEVQLALGAPAPWAALSLGPSFTIHHRHAIGHSRALSAAAPAGLVLSIMSNRWVVHRCRHLPLQSSWAWSRTASNGFLSPMELYAMEPLICSCYGNMHQMRCEGARVQMWTQSFYISIRFLYSCSICYTHCIVFHVISSLIFGDAAPGLNVIMNPVR